MWRALRNTANRGRSEVPSMRLRSERCRFFRPSFLKLTSTSMGGSFYLAAAAATARGTGLADLLLDHFLDVLHALALVRLGGAQLADLRGGLTDQIAIGAGQRQAVLVDLGGDALRQLEHHRVRIAERHRHGVAGDLGAVTDAVDLELARPAVRDALDHVGQVRAHEAVLGAVLALVVGAQHRDLVRLGLDAHPRRDRLGQLALRALDADQAGLLRQGDALRQRQNLSSDSTHGNGLLTRLRTEARRPGLPCGRRDRSSVPWTSTGSRCPGPNGPWESFRAGRTS